MSRQAKPPKIEAPAKDADRPRWGRVGVFAAVGIVVGIAWPKLTGIRIGPEVPGAKDPTVAAVAQVPSEPTATDPSAAPGTTGSAGAAVAAAAVTPSNKQRVIVSQGTILQCWDKNEKLDANQCGTLRLDPVIVPRLRQLASCPAALGLQGELEVSFDLAFDKGELKVVRGKKSELPSTTVKGILECTADFVSDFQHDKLEHKHTKYRFAYTLQFFPPGTGPAPATASDAASAGPAEDPDLATVSWDSVLVRDEPKTGKDVARLVRGTRVKLLGRRKDWCRIKFQGKEGWVHRSALGL